MFRRTHSTRARIFAVSCICPWSLTHVLPTWPALPGLQSLVEPTPHASAKLTPAPPHTRSFSLGLLQYIPALARKRIVLGSASPRRRELLQQLGLQFEVVVSSFEETLPK